MAVIDLSGIPISYPTPADGAETSEPIISHAASDQHAVTLTLTTDCKSFSLNAIIQRHTDHARNRMSLTDRQTHFLDQETREREVVGIMQWHYAHTLLQWVETGELDPFGDIAADHQSTRKSA